MNFGFQQIEWLRQRLMQPLPGISAQELMIGRVIAMPQIVPSHARPSAVLCLLYPDGDDLKLLLMKRREDRTAHSAQVSFPGGKYEPEDADLRSTALREAHEEIGIHPSQVDVLGALTSLYIPVSNYNVFPFVGYIHQRPEFIINQAEVSYVIETSVTDLLHADRKVTTDVSSPIMPGLIRQVKAYKLDNETIIWGATAMIISELETVINEYPGVG